MEVKKFGELGVVERPMMEPPRRPDPAWQRTLDQIAPKGRGMGGLWLYWEPGAGYWDIVNRWMVAQVVPPERTPDWMRELLSGPDPRGFMHYDIVKQQVVRDDNCPPISERQWMHYQLTGEWLIRYWCVQGPRGGHKLKWSKAESTLAQLHGLPAQPAEPGALPYVEPNHWTFDALAKGNRMREFGYLLGKVDQMRLLLDEEERKVAENMRREVWAWMEEQVGELSQELEFAMRSKMDMAPDGDPNLEQNYEELKESFIRGDDA